MAKNAMRKVSNSVFNVVADTKKMSSINVAIFVVSVAIVVVIVILLFKRRKREGFALMSLSEASWNTKGEDGAKGEQGAQGPQGLQGPQGEKDSSKKEELYSDFRKKLIDEMVDNKLIIKEGNEGEEKYFPVGTINLRNVMTNLKETITIGDSKKSFFLKIKYNKLASKSYVKITYLFPMTGLHFRRGVSFKMYVNDNNNAKLISASSATSGAWNDGKDRYIADDAQVIGIDTTDEVGIREYGVEISFPEGPKYHLKDNKVVINGMYTYNSSNYNNADFVASCTIEEVTIADKSNIGKDLDFI